MRTRLKLPLIALSCIDTSSSGLAIGNVYIRRSVRCLNVYIHVVHNTTIKCLQTKACTLESQMLQQPFNACQHLIHDTTLNVCTYTGASETEDQFDVSRIGKEMEVQKGILIFNGF